MFQVKPVASRKSLMKRTIDAESKADHPLGMKTRDRLLTDARAKYDSITHQVRILSLLDVNDKKCQAKGTSLPKQYARIFNQKAKTGSLPSIDNVDVDKERRLNDISPNTSKDIKYKPKELLDHDIFLKDPLLIEKDLIMKHPFMKRLPQLTIREIRNKNHSSNVFNDINCQTESSSSKDYHPALTSPNYKETDVFCLKADKELTLRRHPHYSLLQQSGSEWISVNPLPSFMNYSSIKWSPLNAKISNVAMTKEEIINKGLRTDLSTFHRQKGISEFIDLTRIGATRVNKSMQDWLDQTKGDFKKPLGICSHHGDVFKSYQGLVPQPFTKALY